MFDLAICNTFYNKKDEYLITYRSGNTSSVIDYILVRRDNLVHVRYCKVIPGWWNLKKDEYKLKFVASMYDNSWYDMEYKDVENCILDIAKSKLG